MHNLRRRFLPNCLRAADVGVMVLAFATSLFLSGTYTSPESLSEFLAFRIKLSNFVLFGAFSIAWYCLFKYHGLYRSRRIGHLTTEWWDITKAVGIGTLLLSSLALFLDLEAVNRTFLTTFFVASLFGTFTARTGLRMLLGEVRRRGRNLRNLVIVGCGPRGAQIGSEVRKRPEMGYLLLGYIDDIPSPENPAHAGREKLLSTLGGAQDALSGLQVDEVIIALPIKSHYSHITQLIAICEELSIIVRIAADFFDARLHQTYVDDFQGLPLITLENATPAVGVILLKRSIDLLGSLLGSILLLPVFAIVALAIRLGSSGPILFRQDRVGLNRRNFRVLKFRTMCEDAERRLNELEAHNEVAGAAFKLRRDPRVTVVGRILRKWSLDELPQLWNVLMGDMSLVGPRPLPVRDVEQIVDGWQRRRFSVKPGLTCLWQANGRHEIGFEHWMELDLQYIDNWSLQLDFEIMLKTLPAVLRGSGAS